MREASYKFYSSTKVHIPPYWADMHPDSGREPRYIQRAHRKLKRYQNSSPWHDMPVLINRKKGN